MQAFVRFQSVNKLTGGKNKKNQHFSALGGRSQLSSAVFDNMKY